MKRFITKKHKRTRNRLLIAALAFAMLIVTALALHGITARASKDVHRVGGNGVVPDVAINEGSTLAPARNNDNVFVEIDADGVPLGEWRWNSDAGESGEWTYDAYAPTDELPQTGRVIYTVVCIVVVGLVLIGIGLVLLPDSPNKKKRTK